MPPKTTIERSPSPSPEVTVFKISGTLGFHEKDTLEKLFGECRKRSLNRIVLDVAGLTSLGGGCARIIREEAVSGSVVLGIASAKTTVRKFLKEAGDTLVLADDVEDAVAAVLDWEPGRRPAGASAPSEDIRLDEVDSAEAAPPAPDAAEMDASDDELVSDETLEEVLRRDEPEVRDDVVEGGESVASGVEPPHDAAVPEAPQSDPGNDAAPESDHAAATPTPSDAPGPIETPAPPPAAAQPSTEAFVPPPGTAPEPPSTSPPASGQTLDETRALKKRIVQYNTLLSINGDFGRIHDRRALLEAFLLTTIAQVGVESAIFLERDSGYFYPTSMKGIDAEDVRGLALEGMHLGLEGWQKEPQVHRIDEAPFTDDARAPLLAIGCRYVAPFVSRGEFKGIVLLGKPIRNDLDDSTIEFLRILINQAAIAYESTSLLEEENKRTLGLVHTLISLIEENTLARGNTNMLSNYVYALARSMHMPDDEIRDLMYGTVLRDIGMIKVSDLIVRSPRELMPEEWDVIKHHPIDGAEMLRSMRFSDGAVNVVLCHHERFNGEGYPNGLQGNQIPLGARIVSVVESYAAMLQDRPTRPALSQHDALDTLRENWGMRYDPDIVKHFVELVENEIRTGASIAEKKFELFQV